MTTISKHKILVVDDDPRLLQEVRSYLERQGYEVATVTDGRSALKVAEETSPNLVVLDINFPDSKESELQSLDGMEVLRRLREADNIPVIMLSSTNISTVKVMALQLGADDYLSKPFELKELSARIDAILRRTEHEPPGELIVSFQRLRLDPGERRVWKDGNPLDFTGIEFEILYTLCRRPRHVFTRDKLIEIAWKGNAYCVPKAVDVHIGHIRKKVEDDPSQPVLVLTVRGTGYCFDDALA